MNQFKFKEIEERLNEWFAYIYRSNKDFLTLDHLYRHRCFDAIQNEELMRVIVFNNDYLRIQPVYTFLCYYAKQSPPLFPVDDPWIKKSVGAFWGFVFRKCLGYKQAHTNIIPGRFMNFRTASYFTRE